MKLKKININMADKNKGKKKKGGILSSFIAKGEERMKINKTLSSNKSARLEKEKFQKSLQGMTKEKKIAANKARVAKYHPEPDLTTCSTTVYKNRKKIEFEKKIKEKTKKLWYSIVSVPMGGMKKR